MAGNVNKVILIGRLGQDPKLTYLPSGQPVAELRLATSESYKNKDGEKVEATEWHTVKVYGRSAEFCGNYLSKGRLIYVEGTLRTRSWEDQQGQKKYFTEVIVTAPGHTVQFLDSNKGGGVDNAPSEGGYGGYGGGQQGGYGGGQGGERRGGGAPQQQGNRAQGGGRQGGQRQQPREEDMAPAFPSEASGMDDVPF
ncbi:Single-stranded DNA-binding protein [Fundidesulfovibrio magnetotacticus]|uniref:Single-stranded DNA-binding protein n=1 Tax=Fundidesulfovibrio magnetotacticus TaxID=2730080 RepID=A0A6V8M0B1_9BACT|nr:single-stranded DNA-binding protein [Fundidesulfovibrio magnetotacticus]GFK95699.1 Single-stranded DNA-binding protein [Fundidesulfovibrio magnetotacticus]